MLHLVERTPELQIVDFEGVVADIERRHSAVSHANLLEALAGRTAYTAFLRAHGVFPEPNQALVLARLVGCGVRAADGRVYPGPSVKAKGERMAAAADRRRRAKVAPMISAIEELASANIPQAFAQDLSDDDRLVLAENLERAISLLSRISQAVQNDERVKGPHANT